MKTFLCAKLFLAAIITVCNAEEIMLDLKVSEYANGKEINSVENDFYIEESFVTSSPPVVYLNYTENGTYAYVDEAQEEAFVGREVFDATASEFQEMFGKKDAKIVDEHMNFQSSFGITSGNNPNWSSWSCCRPVTNIRTRQRIVLAPRIELNYQRCFDNFCQHFECKDAIFMCDQFRLQGGCNPSSSLSSFMSHNCPETCNFCPKSARPTQPPTREPSLPWWMRTTTRRPFATRPTQLPWWMTTRRSTTTTTTAPRLPWWAATTTKAPGASNNRGLVKVTVFKHDLDQPYASYKFVKGRVNRVDYPWRRNIDTNSEISSFYLYENSFGVYNMPIRFCSLKPRNKDYEKWTIRKSNCGSAWTEEFVLYGSSYRSKDSKMYFVGNRGKPFWTARISKDVPRRGYVNGIFYFYGPENGNTPSIPNPIQPTRPPRPFTNRPPVGFTTRRPATRPTPPSSGEQPKSTFNKKCLDMHNLYRAVHNVPLLQWSEELATTAERWAKYLGNVAPLSPFEVTSESAKTRNWPHSDGGTMYRGSNTGENIAWDKSSDGSPAEESVRRWYAELFYYDRNNPTRSPGPNKPVGHLTQLLWRDTTHLGCARAVTEVPNLPYKLLSTWTVSHYSPAGNIRIFGDDRRTKDLFDKMVPDMRQGSCLLNSGACNDGNQCMAFGSPTGRRATCTCFNQKPTCRGQHGCIANCENKNRSRFWRSTECHGTTECKCTDEGAVCK